MNIRFRDQITIEEITIATEKNAPDLRGGSLRNMPTHIKKDLMDALRGLILTPEQVLVQSVGS